MKFVHFNFKFLKNKIRFSLNHLLSISKIPTHPITLQVPNQTRRLSLFIHISFPLITVHWICKNHFLFSNLDSNSRCILHPRRHLLKVGTKWSSISRLFIFTKLLCLSTQSCEWLLFIGRGRPLISRGSLGCHYHRGISPLFISPF